MDTARRSSKRAPCSTIPRSVAPPTTRSPATRTTGACARSRRLSTGTRFTRDKWRLVSLAHVAETREQARRNVEFGLEDWAKYFREIATFPIVPPEIDDAYEYLTENRLALIGTPDDAIAYIERLLEGSGGFGAFLELAHNWADFAATKRHFELMARYVMPHFQGKNILRRFSYDYSHRNRERFVESASRAVQAEIDRYAQNKAPHDTAAGGNE